MPPKNTYTQQYSEDPSFETVIGDEKQEKFLPRIKFKKWYNEANLSIGLKDEGGTHYLDGNLVTYQSGNLQARFYPLKSKSEADISVLRYVPLGGVDPTMVPKEYELFHHLPSSELVVTSYWSRVPALMYFGTYPADVYTDKVDIPEVRAASSEGNPYYMDDGLVMIDVHYNGEGDYQSLLTQATIDVLKRYGVEAYNKGAKLYYQDPDGHDVKIASPQTDRGHTWTYINVNTEYTRYTDYYKDSVEKQVNDPYAYGLKRHHPNIGNNIVDEVIERFAELLDARFYTDSLTDIEKSKLESLEVIHQDPQWVRYAQRSDIGWWYQQEDGYEFEIVLGEKPASNVVPLSVTTKNLQFSYQPELTPEEAKTSYRPPYVVGSYAAYHISKRDNEYQTGKAFHIYRPWVTDANGQKVWCDFDQYWDGSGDLNITIPQDFLDNAVYPIKIDPTFGYTTMGASTVSAHNKVQGLVNTTGVIGNYVHIVVGTNRANGRGKAALYLTGSTKVVGSDEDPSIQDTWLFLTIASTAILTVGYDLVFWATGIYQVIAYDTQASAGGTASLTYVNGNDGFPATQSLTGNDNRYSIYATTVAYSPSASTSPSASLSPSTSVSPSSSVSASRSPSASSSPSASLSPSASVSTSLSPSASISASVSPSASLSPSSSVSVSLSPSSSISASLSPSTSISASLSPSSSASASSSPSASLSPSSSASASYSPSSSASPSPPAPTWSTTLNNPIVTATIDTDASGKEVDTDASPKTISNPQTTANIAGSTSTTTIDNEPTSAIL